MSENNIKNNDLLTLNHELNEKILGLNNDLLTTKNDLKITKNDLEIANKKIEELSLLIAMNKARTFTKKKETIDLEERNLFNYNELEENASITIEEAKEELVTKKINKKNKNHSNIDFESLVTETVIHDPSENLEGAFINISEDIVYKAHVDLNVSVTKHIFKTVKNTETNEMLSENRNFVFPNSIASPSLVSYLANEKYTMGTPLYRQESAFLSIGFPISRPTMSNMLMSGSQLLLPFYKYLKHLLINNDRKVIHADETTLKVINVGNKKKKEKCYMWLYTTAATDLPIYIYEYKYSREGRWPREFLKDFKGYLVADDYQGYNHIPNVIVQKCFTHARRKFFDIYNANKDPKMELIVNMIDDIYKLEASYKKDNLTSDEIYELRNDVVHINTVNTLFNHLENLNYAPNSVNGKAVGYSVKLKPKLLTYLKDGNIPLDNNLAERGIKPFVINRKNFLFSNTERGADSSSIYMSIVQTAKTNGLDPKKYMEYLFTKLHEYNLINLNLEKEEEKTKAFNLMKDLLPWNDEIKSMFKMKEVSR